MKNKNLTSNKIMQMVTFSIICLNLMFSIIGCSVNQAATIDNIGSNIERLVVIAPDETYSFDDYRKIDTSFVSAVCHSVSISGGMVVVYGIGEPTDRSGIRCVLKQVPLINSDLVLSRQAELRQKINSIIADNEKRINEFIRKVQIEIFTPISDTKRKRNITDINGFFNKVAVLLDEPVIQNMNKYVFCYSDGIQSLNGKDSPAIFKAIPQSKFTLCLAGWKTKLPSDSIHTLKFEDPTGFLQYINSNHSFNH